MLKRFYKIMILFLVLNTTYSFTQTKDACVEILKAGITKTRVQNIYNLEIAYKEIVLFKKEQFNEFIQKKGTNLSFTSNDYNFLFDYKDAEKDLRYLWEEYQRTRVLNLSEHELYTYATNYVSDNLRIIMIECIRVVYGRAGLHVNKTHGDGEKFTLALKYIDAAFEPRYWGEVSVNDCELLNKNTTLFADPNPNLIKNRRRAGSGSNSATFKITGASPSVGISVIDGRGNLLASKTHHEKYEPVRIVFDKDERNALDRFSCTITIEGKIYGHIKLSELKYYHIETSYGHNSFSILEKENDYHKFRILIRQSLHQTVYDRLQDPVIISGIQPNGTPFTFRKDKKTPQYEFLRN